MIEWEKLLYKNCYIIPFENLQGRIVAIMISKRGVELQVRYCLNGVYKLEWFFDFDVYYEENLS